MAGARPDGRRAFEPLTLERVEALNLKRRAAGHAKGKKRRYSSPGRGARLRFN